jgi:hypothetical protein
MGWVPPPAPAPALGNCFTGTCAAALAPYGWTAPPCGQPPVPTPPPVPPTPPAPPIGFWGASSSKGWWGGGRCDGQACAYEGDCEAGCTCQNGACRSGAISTVEFDRGISGPQGQAPQANALGNCFTGTCAAALAPYGWASPPCGLPPVQAAAWSMAARIVARRAGFLGRQ